MKEDNFVTIPFTPKNLDLYIVRTSILKALNNSLPYFKGKLIDIGCGKMPYRSHIQNNSAIVNYTGLDLAKALEYDSNVKPDFTWDGITMPFADESFDCAMATEVLEHCPDPNIILGETNRILKPGGILFFTVPFLWNLHEVPHDEYRYTPFALKRIFINAGFKEVNLKALGGWDASLAQMIGLWSRRRPLKGSTRKIVSWITFFIVKYLFKKDVIPKAFREGTMITGIWGIATK